MVLPLRIKNTHGASVNPRRIKTYTERMTNVIKKILDPLASLKLTVVLFAMAMFLIFAGTLAQVHQGIWTVMGLYFRSFIVWIDLQLFVPGGLTRLPGRFPFPGGFSVGSLLLVNLVAAHTVRFKFTRKRLGIVILHLGIVLLLVGEWVTAVFAQEANMTIDEGSWANYTEDVRQAELAIVDRADPNHDQVVAIAQSLLARQDGVIRHPRLPFGVTIDRWMNNSQLVGPREGPQGHVPRATAGFGRQISARQVPEVTGVESQVVDAPSAYITLWDQNQKLGTWLVSLYIDQDQPVQIGGKTYHLRLRFKRTYKPYTIHLIDFRHDKYTGTDKPRNFSSLIRLTNPSQNEDREVLIYMNHPLRYNGETFYQASFKAGDTGTVLQVVRNPGWLIPYASCTLVSLGMLIHFGMHLVGFSRRMNPSR